jgi:hypothetical protein
VALGCEPTGITAADGTNCSCGVGYAGGGEWSSAANGSWVDPLTAAPNTGCHVVECPGGDVSDAFVCTCDAGAIGGGPFVATNRSYPACRTVPCLNGELLSETVCKCGDGYTGGGDFNETLNRFAICTPTDCPNGDIAEDLSSCSCHLGYFGGGGFDSAAELYPACAPSSCPNGVITADKARCNCDMGYSGSGSFDIEVRAYPNCTAVGCPNGTISGDRAKCTCGAAYLGGGFFDDSTDRYPTCFDRAACDPAPAPACAAGQTCGYAADGCGGMGGCGQCAYGTTCSAAGSSAPSTCSRTGLCNTVVVTSANGLQIADWVPELAGAGDEYTRHSHWAARPVFESKQGANGWNQTVYLYWYPGNVFPAEIEVGWYIAATVGSEDPLAFLPERIPIPVDHSVPWRFGSAADGGWQEEPAVTASCKGGSASLVLDYHQAAAGGGGGLEPLPWYGEDTTCLLYSNDLGRCLKPVGSL